ncbi:MAG: SUMF1/EgtB/PvdO family nonheme iron enzyme [Pyrinomonadaceae bacterium]
MNHRDDDPKNRPNFDLTTPNIGPPDRQPPGHPEWPTPQATNFDQTAPNVPFPQRGDNRPSPPAAGHNNFDLTGVNAGVPDAEEDDAWERNRSGATAPVTAPLTAPLPSQPQYQPEYQPQPQHQPQYQSQYQPMPLSPQAAPRRGVPVWAWLLGGGGVLGFLFLLVAAVGLYFFWPFSSTFTLKVVDAPPGSKVFVDNTPVGVSQADGSILAPGLRAGEQREVRVTHEDYNDWSTTVNGVGGETTEVTAGLGKKAEEEPTLRNEIDYNGAMLLIPAGEFSMGDDDGSRDARPAHKVTLSDYYIDKHEVTNEQYKKFCDATGHPAPANPFWSPQYFESTPQGPVIGVSYEDAVAYAAWAGKRLPTEAEWEKAASWDPKTNQKRRWPWGDDAEQGRANLGATEPSPQTVGSFAGGASAYGVLDMAGNVTEWVDGTYDAYPGNTARNRQFGKNLRVLRGGHFGTTPDYARTTVRLPMEAEFKTKPEDAKANPPKSSLAGFRCAVSAADPKLQAFLRQTGR